MKLENKSFQITRLAVSMKPSFEGRVIKNQCKILYNNNTWHISLSTAKAQIHGLVQLHYAEKKKK